MYRLCRCVAAETVDITQSVKYCAACPLHVNEVRRACVTTLLEKLVNVRKNQARYFRKIYGTGSLFVFSVSLRNKMRFRYFSSSCSTNGISGITQAHAYTPHDRTFV